MSYIFLSLLAATFFALSLVFNKFISKHKIDNKNSLMFYFMLSTFVFSFLLLPFSSRTLPPFVVLTNITIATIAFLVGYYFFFIGISDTDASVFAPLFQLQAVLVAFLAYMFLGERFSVSNYLWIALIIGGVILVSVNENMKLKTFLKKGFMFILAMQLLHAISNLFVGFSLKEVSFIDMLFWEYIVIGICIIPFYLVAKPKLNYQPKSLGLFSVTTVLSSVGALFLFKAYEQNLTISSTLSLMSSPIVFIISILASRFRPELLEHHTSRIYLIRALGVVFILIGAIKLSLG